MRGELESLLEHHRPETLVDQPLSADPLTRTGATTGSITRTVATVASKVLGGQKRRAAAWILAAVILAGVAYFALRQVRQTSESQLREQLRVVLNADDLAVETWINDWLREAKMWANTPAVRAQAEKLVKEAGGDSERARKLGDSKELAGNSRTCFQPFTPEFCRVPDCSCRSRGPASGHGTPKQ